VHERVGVMVSEPQTAGERVWEQRSEEGDREDGLAKRHCVLVGRRAQGDGGAVLVDGAGRGGDSVRWVLGPVGKGRYK
jgi:hypothetical protein